MSTDSPNRPEHQHAGCPYDCPASREITNISEDVKQIKDALIGENPMIPGPNTVIARLGRVENKLRERDDILDANKAALRIANLESHKQECEAFRKSVSSKIWMAIIGVAALIGTSIWTHVFGGGVKP